jgi:glycosyltransferase involved in cell wall biosynthesis
MKKSRILFIAPHRPDRSPGQRFRFEQYLSYLETQGFDCQLSYMITAEDDKVLYKQGNYAKKLFIHLRSLRRRRNDAARANEFDIIFIFREALLTGSTRFETLFARSRAKVVYDFDDAIWHLDVSAANRMLAWLKKPGKTGKIIGMSDMVFAGNNYLAEYARRFNSNVVIVPTTIDTDEYRREAVDREPGTLTIGWSGSITTIKHFEFALPFLRRLKKTHGHRLAIKVIGDGSYVNEELGIRGLAWRKEDEVRELSSFDIGIMPLPDDEWANGKCGLKGLQYMALGIPTLMSPVGVNSEIVQQGVNGFLPATMDDWVGQIETLIASPELRRSMGEAARTTVEAKYSVNAWKEKYVGYFDALLR